MSLNPEPFESIKNGNKTIEIRLFDEKRQKVQPKDIIVFTKLPDKKEKIAVEVIDLAVFSSFRELLSNFDKSKFGHSDKMTLEEQIERQREHYTEDEERRYGVVGIKIKLIDRLPDNVNI
jgi:ASC-1-like (ASCH) protein